MLDNVGLTNDRAVTIRGGFCICGVNWGVVGASRCGLKVYGVECAGSDFSHFGGCFESSPSGDYMAVLVSGKASHDVSLLMG